MTRALIIDSVAKVKIARAIEWAEMNPYHPMADPTPGDNESYVTMLNTYKCVFTFTITANRKVYRHLSISVPVEDKYPNPWAAFTIATEFGFTGWDGASVQRLPSSWHGSVSEAEHCIVLIQEKEDK